MGNKKAKANYRRTVLRLPDLDHSKAAVLNSLTSPGSRRVYRYAIEQFIAWYCAEPRLAFNRIVVVRYRMYLEGRGLAANTINQQLARQNLGDGKCLGDPRKSFVGLPDAILFLANFGGRSLSTATPVYANHGYFLSVGAAAACAVPFKMASSSERLNSLPASKTTEILVVLCMS
jgi:hypothetical protein